MKILPLFLCTFSFVFPHLPFNELNNSLSSYRNTFEKEDYEAQESMDALCIFLEKEELPVSSIEKIIESNFLRKKKGAARYVQASRRFLAHNKSHITYFLNKENERYDALAKQEPAWEIMHVLSKGASLFCLSCLVYCFVKSMTNRTSSWQSSTDTMFWHLLFSSVALISSFSIKLWKDEHESKIYRSYIKRRILSFFLNNAS